MRDRGRVGTWSVEHPVIERASSADLAFLAMEAGNIPQQFAPSYCWNHPVISACLAFGR